MTKRSPFSYFKTAPDALLENVLSEGLCMCGTIAEKDPPPANMRLLRDSHGENARQPGYIQSSDITVAVSGPPNLLRWTQKQRADLRHQGIRILPFSHAGDNNLHINYVVMANNDQSLNGELLEKLYAQVDRLGGSVSVESGVARATRSAVTSRRSNAAIDLLLAIKRAVDHHNRMTPGVVLAEQEDLQ